MDFNRIFTFIRNSVAAILVFSGIWILLNWLYDITTLENPPALKEAAQNFINYWSKSFSKVKIF